MQYEQDYIMRLIRQVIRALVYVLLDKKMGEHYEMPANRIVKSGDDLLYRLLSLADAGQICEAENRLYAQMEKDTDQALLMALAFYDHINAYDDAFLETHNFSREEIRQGVAQVAKRMGKSSMAVLLMKDDD